MAKKTIIEQKNELPFFIICICYLIVRGFPIPQSLYWYQSLNWLSYAMLLAMWLLIALMILIKRKELENYNIDLLSILIILVAVVIFPFSNAMALIPPTHPIKFLPIIFSILWLGMAMTLIILLIKNKIRLIKPDRMSFLWVVGAILIGVFFFIFTLMFDPAEEQTLPAGYITNISTFSSYFLYFLVTGGILEETFFRGFLWGRLRKKKIPDKYILIIQAVLFWIVHIDYYSRPFAFWVALPLFSLITGLLAWKSRSVIAPIIVHAIYNTLQYF